GPDAAVQHYRHPVADRRLYRVEGRRRLVELAPAVVRRDDPLAAEFGGADRVARIHDPLDDQVAREQAAVFFELAPGLRVSRGVDAEQVDDLIDGSTGGRIWHPVFERGGPAVADILDDPAGMGDRLGKDR